MKKAMFALVLSLIIAPAYARQGEQAVHEQKDNSAKQACTKARSDATSAATKAMTDAKKECAQGDKACRKAAEETYRTAKTDADAAYKTCVEAIPKK